MLLFQVLFAFLSSIQLAQAFYPWTPAYRCILDHTCIASKRELEAEAEAAVDVRGEDSLKIIQRVPEVIPSCQHRKLYLT
jgi:hypothetical protein